MWGIFIFSLMAHIGNLLFMNLMHGTFLMQAKIAYEQNDMELFGRASENAADLALLSAETEGAWRLAIAFGAAMLWSVIRSYNNKENTNK